MAKKMLIDATHAEETRVVVVDGNKIDEFDFETQSRRQIQGNIYLAKVMRVEPSLQAAFVDYGGNRHGFLAFSEIHPDYYQIPVADREALMAEEEAYAAAAKEEEEAAEKPKPRRRRTRSRAAAANQDAVITKVPDEDATVSAEISGMEMMDADDTDGTNALSVDVIDQSSELTEIIDDSGRDSAAAVAETEVTEASQDETEDLRPRRKPRPRKYKIQEVVNVRQIMLIQVVKEERGNKGAALTTYLSLAGRYCVLMPNTARGGGISRKITNAADRKKLKDIANAMEVPKGAGLIIRTAGSQRTKAEIKRDYEYLQRLWEQIRQLTLGSVAPAKIYEEGDLIKRSIRDLYNREIDEVVVEGEAGYRVAKDFMKMIMPSHAKNVKHYQETMPLYARHQVETHLTAMFNPTVQLPSGGYIVIGITEALVAIDVNSGKATKEGSIEQTALKTNLEAAEEVARQFRLRDLAGLIVIDFIDMDERKNNTAVEKRLKDKLKTDRARIQLGKISSFGLLEMSRQRLRPGMLEATTQPCPHCHGTGLLRSDDNVALAILRALEEEGVRGRTREVLVRAPVEVLNYLINQKREHIAQIEARYGMAVRLEGDTALVSPDYALEKFKSATRQVTAVAAPVVVSTDAMVAEEAEAETVEPTVATEAPETTQDADENPRKKRRRRRRRRGSETAVSTENVEAAETDTAEPEAESAAPEVAESETTEDKPKRKRSRSRSRKKPVEEVQAAETKAEDAPVAAAEEVITEDAPKKPARKRGRRRKSDVKPAEDVSDTPTVDAADMTETVQPKAQVEATEENSAGREAVQTETQAVEDVTPVVDASTATQEPVVVEAKATTTPVEPSEPDTAEADAEPSKPKRRGWWSAGK